MPIAVGHHTHDPIVAQTAFRAVHRTLDIVFQFARCGIVYTEPARESGYIYVFPVIGHIVELVALESNPQIRLARHRIIYIEAVIGAKPIPAPAVTENKLGGRRRLGTGHYTAVAVETEHAVALHRAPHDTVIALADRSNRRADTDFLGRKAPIAEPRLATREHEESLRLATDPYIAVTILGDSPYLGCVKVDTLGDTLYPLKPAASVREAEKPVSASAYIDVPRFVFIYRKDRYSLIRHHGHVYIRHTDTFTPPY